MHIFPRYLDDEFEWKCKKLTNSNSLEFIKNKLKAELQVYF